MRRTSFRVSKTSESLARTACKSLRISMQFCDKKVSIQVYSTLRIAIFVSQREIVAEVAF